MSVSLSRERHQPSDLVGELSDVPRPVPDAQPLDGLTRHADALLFLLAGEPAQEPPDERRDVLATISQRRDANANDVEAIEQILAEALIANHLFDVRVGGGHDAHVYLHGPRLADRLNLTVLEEPQQLGLNVRFELADLVQEQGAAVGALNHPGRVLARAGERSAAVTEELRVDDLAAGPGAVVGDEQTPGTAGTVVDDARDDFLAGAGFAR